MLNLWHKGKKIKVNPKHSMVIKVLAKYGITSIEVLRMGSEPYYIYAKDTKENIHRVGIAKPTRDGRFTLIREFKDILENTKWQR